MDSIAGAKSSSSSSSADYPTQITVVIHVVIRSSVDSSSSSSASVLCSLVVSITESELVVVLDSSVVEVSITESELVVVLDSSVVVHDSSSSADYSTQITVVHIVRYEAGHNLMIVVSQTSSSVVMDSIVCVSDSSLVVVALDLSVVNALAVDKSSSFDYST